MYYFKYAYIFFWQSLILFYRWEIEAESYQMICSWAHKKSVVNQGIQLGVSESETNTLDIGPSFLSTLMLLEDFSL